MDIFFIVLGIVIASNYLLVVFIKIGVPAIRRKVNFVTTVKVKDENIIAIGHCRYSVLFHCPACGKELKGTYTSDILGRRTTRESCVCLNCRCEVSRYADGVFVAHYGIKIPSMNEIIIATGDSQRAKPDNS